MWEKEKKLSVFTFSEVPCNISAMVAPVLAIIESSRIMTNSFHLGEALFTGLLC